jgi:hypothetical protein
MAWVASGGILSSGTPSTVALGLWEAPCSVGLVRKAVKQRGDDGGGSEASTRQILVLKGVAGVGFL